jgi:hypothetical protein
MKSLGKLLGIPLLVVALAYAGVKYYVYYQTRSTFEHYTQMVAMLVAIEAGSFSSDLWTGTVEINDLTLKPNGMSDTVTIESVSLSAGSLRRYLRFTGDIKNKQVPDALSVAVRGLVIDLNGDILDTVDKYAAGTQASVRMPHCGDQALSGLPLLRRLAYSTLRLDMGIKYSFNEQAKLLKYDMNFTAHDMGQVAIDMRMVGISTEPSAEQKPQLREFGITIRDLSYNDRLKSYCAGAAKTTVDEYVKAEVENGGLRQAGVVFGAGLRDAYRDYLTTPKSEIQLRMRPGEDLDPASLALYKPEDLVEMLNLTLTVNGKPVDDLSFSIGPPPTVAASPGEQDSKPTEVKPVAAAPAPAREADTAEPSGEYRVVPVADLSRYIHRQVRLHERGQKPREGTLLEVTGGSAVVERFFSGGSMSLKVPLGAIAKAEVQF